MNRGWRLAVVAFAVGTAVAFLVVSRGGDGESRGAPGFITGVGGARIPTAQVVAAMAGLCTARGEADSPERAVRAGGF